MTKTVTTVTVTIELDWLRAKINQRLDRHLSEMKPGFDDSITGFNEAWDLVRKILDEIER